MRATARVLPTLCAAAACAILAGGCAFAGSAARNGTGWTIARLDLEVRVSDEEPSMEMGGTLVARLGADRSFGPSFRVNANGSGIRWRSVEAAGARRVELNDRAGGATLAHVRFAEAFAEGDEIEVAFELALETGSSQLLANDKIALASWIHAWYPHPKQADGTFTAGTMSFPGTTTFRLPAGWIAISDGRLLRREAGDEETVEVWELSARSVARSFAAGPFRSAEREVDGRRISIYLLDDHPITADRLADLLVETMAALESRLGDFPFDGYGVVEVPNEIEGWAAASQQTFIMAKSNAFEFAHGNVPLWAHEMGHAWWGNTVGTRGPGSKMAGEALAQLGVLIVLEALEGRRAVVEFLEFSRSGYNARQCARGYFGLVDEGKDHPLAKLGSSSLTSGQTHNLADSKGMWVYYMLWQRLGDELFFGTLRRLIAEFAGRGMRLDDVRRAFVAAAPDRDLEAFFAQWLDRTGGIEVDASVTARHGTVDLLLTQSKGKPFEFELEVELQLDDGTTRRERVEVRGRETRASFAVEGRLAGIELDPDRRLLMRREAYGAMPDVAGIAQTADWLVPETYTGEYQPDESPHRFTVVEENGALWARTPEGSMRLWPSADTAHRFRATHGWVSFEVGGDRATAARYEVDDGMTLKAVRIEPADGDSG